MRTFHYVKGNEFCVFIEKSGGVWFEICGRGSTPNDVGRYVDDSKIDEEFKRLTENGYKKRRIKAN